MIKNYQHSKQSIQMKAIIKNYLAPQLFNLSFCKFLICSIYLRNRREISLLILSEFKQKIIFYSPLKSTKNVWFSDDFRGNES